jgi:nucleoside deoxyribosyltransferase
MVEDFGLPKNLMIACAARVVHGDARACLAAMAECHYAPQRHRQIVEAGAARAFQ